MGRDGCDQTIIYDVYPAGQAINKKGCYEFIKFTTTFGRSK